MAERYALVGADLLGISPAIERLRAEIRAVAASGFRTVLIQGESGVGKEVAAEALRRASTRYAGPHEVFDCPAVPEDHLESELFGTARGAFPGAMDKRGALERSHGGTIFFDEIAAMRPDHQAKVLRAIEGRSFRRVGGSAPVAVDVAVIAAAHEDLAALATQGAFRQDLYYRLIRDGVLMIPPLRDRREDVAVLARHYVLAMHGEGVVRIEAAAMEHLSEYEWPGNVRQLQTAIRVALRLTPGVLSASGVVEALRTFGALAPRARPTVANGVPPLAPSAGALPVRQRWGDVVGVANGRGFHAITASIQRRTLLQAYEEAAGNKTAAGILLGFHLSPGEDVTVAPPLTENRRNLALRKFRYWCDRLGVAGSLDRQPTDYRPSGAPLAEDVVGPRNLLRGEKDT